MIARLVLIKAIQDNVVGVQADYQEQKGERLITQEDGVDKIVHLLSLNNIPGTKQSTQSRIEMVLRAGSAAQLGGSRLKTPI